MQTTTRPASAVLGSLALAVSLSILAGCQSEKTQPAQDKSSAAPTQPAAAPAAAAAPAVSPAPAPAAAPQAAAPAVTPAPTAAIHWPVRIKAGVSTPFTDADGNVWLPDQGFADGDITDRPDDTQITNTKTPALYRSERYSMTAFSYPVPNGKYIVKLHFAETFDGITAPGERVFSFNVAGHQFDNFDIWVKAGGPYKAYIETVNVEVTNGKLDISFKEQVEHPEINGIEIMPGT